MVIDNDNGNTNNNIIKTTMTMPIVHNRIITLPVRHCKAALLFLLILAGDTNW